MSTSQPKQVGPIVFAIEQPRKQLIEHGEVVTFRPRKRTTGETWARWERTGLKKMDVRVEQLCVTSLERKQLFPYVTVSGFNHVTEWLDVIRDLYGELPEVGYLYRVTVRETE